MSACVRQPTALATKRVRARRLPWRGYEPDEGIRWTNGTSGLPADLFSACSGPLDIEITTAGATQYLDEGVPLSA